MPKKEHYSWNKFERDVNLIAKKLHSRRKSFDGVWGPPRGGLPLAVVLSHALKLPFLLKPKSRKTLIVDDISDTGETLHKFLGKNFIVTLFYHTQSITPPNLWLRKKGNKWIIFPWERK